jgi:asparagine synthase (glutamine-hydrolysing)
VPVGVFLSAGIDSTILASFAREFTPRVTAFTVGLGMLPDGDESGIAAGTAAHLGIRHVGVQVDATMLPDAWHHWFASNDSPSIDGFNTYLVSRQLAAEGVVVGLSGLGADELFGGYSIFGRAPRWSRMLQAIRFIPGPVRSRVVFLLGALDGRVAAFEKLADLVAGDTSVAGVARSLRRTFSNTRLAAMQLAPAAAGLADDFLPTRQLRWDPDLDGDAFNAVSRFELTHYMGDTLLRDTDANSMRHSPEVRVPFLDRPLVDYVTGLPGRTKILGDATRKKLLRMACEGMLPPIVRRRPKTGFTLPIGFWMRNQMRDACEAAIQRLEETAVLDGQAVRGIWDEFLAPASCGEQPARRRRIAPGRDR